MIRIAQVLFAATLLLLSTAMAADTFTGTITDTMCKSDHTAMKVTPESKCVKECVKYGAKYALLVGKNVYTLSDQEAPAKYAAQKVTVTGVLDPSTKVLKVQKIQPAK